MRTLELGISAVEKGWVPDVLTRSAIRRLCRDRLQSASLEASALFTDSLSRGPIAIAVDRANEQHYEVPAEFFGAVLGPRRKYSCCWWPRESTTLAEAEEAALETTCERAEIADGHAILDLGCGWGSLSIWIAERYPHCRITAVSNSKSQRAHIEGIAAQRRLSNLRVITAEAGDFAPTAEGPFGERFDRIVSVEMFEHIRNHKLLLERIAAWLHPGGKLFVHLFCHKNFAYPFSEEGASNWMGRHFFTGGMMPSAELLPGLGSAMRVEKRWTWNGEHYRRTAEAWLANLDARRDEALFILADAHGVGEARVRLNRWRMFFLAVAELFGFENGEEWFVSHYLMEPAVVD